MSLFASGERPRRVQGPSIEKKEKERVKVKGK